MKSAMELAQYTEHLNTKRKKLQQEDMVIVNNIISKPEYKQANVLVIFDPRLHSQVVGIEASNVVGKTNKPTDIIGHMVGDPKDVFRGSGRSIPEYNMFTAMNPLAPDPSHPNKKNVDMESFGGHPMACGFTIKGDKINKFRHDLLNEKISKDLGHVVPTEKPNLIATISQLNKNTYKQLRKLEPCGQNNEQPLVYLKVPQIYNLNTMGDGTSISFTLQPDKKSTRVVGFKMDTNTIRNMYSNPKHYELIGNINMNYFRGKASVQFVMQKIKHYHVPITRHLLGDLYQHLNYLEQIQPSVNLPTLVGFTNEDLKQTKIGLKIFEELNIIRIKNGNIIIHHFKHKKSLQDSPTFQKYSAKR